MQLNVHELVEGNSNIHYCECIVYWKRLHRLFKLPPSANALAA